ncbi:hypothetical protein HZA41_03120 [Candidatus Peregrinibacteria bacterium]|nr:hypothetical protein [Candidatus Peregrinibacteria bacterium]
MEDTLLQEGSLSDMDVENVGFFGFFQLFIVLALFFVMGNAAYFTVLKIGEQRNVEVLNTKISETEQKISKMQYSESVYLAGKASVLVDEQSVSWHKVISDMHLLTPDNVSYLSYAGTDLGNLTVSAVTDSYDHAANFITTFSSSDSFENVFVPVLSTGLAEDGSAVVTFHMFLDYREPVTTKVSRK